jgi:glycosyltransferase involved in cell wall biosynthesis
LNVLHLHTGTLYGGVERFLLLLARERGLCPEMQPSYGICLDGQLVRELREHPVDVSVLGDVRLSRPLSILAVRKTLQSVLREQRPDVAVCHVAKTYWLFGPVLRQEKIPVAYFLHSPAPTDIRLFDKSFTRGIPADIFDRLIGHGVPPDLLLGISRHTVNLSVQHQFPTAETAVMHCPMPWPFARYEMDDATRKAVRAELETPEDAVVIVMASRLSEWKGHRNLITGLGLLKDEPNWYHWMIGGPQTPGEEAFYAELQQMAKENGIADRVRFLGQRSDVPRLVGSADIYCQANIGSEGFSQSFVEAFSAGVPVVTTDIGSAFEMVGDEAGLLTPVGDHPALAEALRSLIRDGDRRKALGASAKKRARALCDTEQQLNLLHNELKRIVR